MQNSTLTKTQRKRCILKQPMINVYYFLKFGSV